jgi:hypothetical protein
MSEENLDRITREMFENGGLESPSASFTNNVMSSIEMAHEPVFQPTPLISKKGWIMLAASVVALVTLIVLFGVDSAAPTVSSPIVAKGSEMLTGALNALGSSLAGAKLPMMAGVIFLSLLMLLGLDQLLKKKLTFVL